MYLGTLRDRVGGAGKEEMVRGGVPDKASVAGGIAVRPSMGARAVDGSGVEPWTARVWLPLPWCLSSPVLLTWS